MCGAFAYYFMELHSKNATQVRIEISDTSLSALAKHDLKNTTDTQSKKEFMKQDRQTTQRTTHQSAKQQQSQRANRTHVADISVPRRSGRSPCKSTCRSEALNFFNKSTVLTSGRTLPSGPLPRAANRNHLCGLLSHWITHSSSSMR